MKKNIGQSLFVQLLAWFCLSMLFVRCGSSKATTTSGDSKNSTGWFDQHAWLNGLQLTPHSSINKKEFQTQYQKNNKWWNEAFEFLKTSDLENLKPGRYIIDTGNVIATISDVQPKDQSEVNWEEHRNFNDLQYIIMGKANMGVASLQGPSITSKTAYAERGDTETFNVANGVFYVGEPGTFFIFSPQDVHKPAVKIAGYDNIRKVVIKVRVPK
ncbi:MAG: YhcH/YjgK/YiaL family protein [Panacibacter sp.]